MKLRTILIKEIDSSFAEELADLLSLGENEYSKYFIPFNFDRLAIKEILAEKKEDKFFGLFVDDSLIGFYMLRGFDEGYEIPSYGVWISEEYSAKGLSKLTLQHAVSICKINGVKKLLLKVHPENKIAKMIYENFGFKREGIDEKNSNLIYYKRLD
jgi:RimJ/RimL family protein N-acetyltransferase